MSNDINITEEQWEEYRDIQMSGLYNMFDPNAREATSLSKSQWIYIMGNYEKLEEKYEGDK